ncbi:hypothetical protein GJAV_G00051910 [Gymnothorax javanicus]|nr:hypothetical protein GJAV_G00051910 [Gymnothorax javanicus]
MDHKLGIFTLFLLYTLWKYAASQELQHPSNVTVVLQDGEAMLVWVPPAEAPSEAYYTVQLLGYNGKPQSWTTVSACEKTRSTNCDLTDFTTHIDIYFARVQMVKDEKTSKWSQSKKFNRRSSKLLPPIFTLNSTSISLHIRVHRKPALKVTFAHGLLYTYHLQQKGQDFIVNITDKWSRDEEGEVEKDVRFDHLTPGQEYCVHMTVEDTAGDAISEASPEQCILLQGTGADWFTAAMVIGVFLSSVLVLSFPVLLLHCCLTRPKTLPSTLKPLSLAWQPLILGDVTVEKVTDKGWLLISPKRNEELGWKEEGGETRRDSMDSGVSMDRTPSESGISKEVDGGDGERKLEDSGCGSLGGTVGDSSGGGTRVSEQHPLLDGRTPEGGPPRGEDSGLGLGCGTQYNGSNILQEGDCTDLSVEAVQTGDGYRSQKPSFMVVQDTDIEKPSEGITSETDNSIEITTVGYRPSQLSCVCLGKGLCLWCKTVAPLLTKEHFVCSLPTAAYGDQSHVSSISCIPNSYLRKNNAQNDGALVRKNASFVCNIPQTESVESIRLLIPAPQSPPLCERPNSSVNAPSLSLQDVELTFG